MQMKSRLSKRVENQALKSIVLTVVGIIVVIVLLVKFGIPLFANISFMLGSGNTKEDISKKKSSYVAPPTLNNTFSATNSATITVSGSAPAKQTITLYVNNEKVDETTANDSNSFSFGQVNLKPGDNSIKAKATDDTKTQSDFSNELTVTLLNKAPSLTIDSPSDGQEFKKDDKTASVTGKTDPGVKVTINDFWAIVDEKGNYSYSLPLHDGDNDIKIVATDDAGNKTEQSRKVKYAQ